MPYRCIPWNSLQTHFCNQSQFVTVKRAVNGKSRRTWATILEGMGDATSDRDRWYNKKTALACFFSAFLGRDTHSTASGLDRYRIKKPYQRLRQWIYYDIPESVPSTCLINYGLRCVSPLSVGLHHKDLDNTLLYYHALVSYSCITASVADYNLGLMRLKSVWARERWWLQRPLQRPQMTNCRRGHNSLLVNDKHTWLI
jgi:hypothetical protein